MFRKAVGVGGVKFIGINRYEGVHFNVISVTRRWVAGVGDNYPDEKHNITLQ